MEATLELSTLYPNVSSWMEAVQLGIYSNENGEKEDTIK
jgi:hypothetical protein